ncbi:MAG: hypothetical protein WC474_11305 [Hydrogenophilaceae bacterium]
MIKPPGTDPAKLAEHAKALQELGYQVEAVKLYEHACQWGYAPACAQAKAPGSQVARPATPTTQTTASVPQPKSPAAAMAKPAPATVVATKAAPSPASPVAQPATSPATSPSTPPPAAHAMVQPAPAAPVVAHASPPPAPPAAPVVLAAAKPMAPPPPPAKPATVDTRKLSQQAHGLEDLGYVPVAVTLYKDACLAGDGLSCKRLGEIYIKGINGVQRDYAESVRWYDRARKLGIDIPALEKRTVYR